MLVLLGTYYRCDYYLPYVWIADWHCRAYHDSHRVQLIFAQSFALRYSNQLRALIAMYICSNCPTLVSSHFVIHALVMSLI